MQGRGQTLHFPVRLTLISDGTSSPYSLWYFVWCGNTEGRAACFNRVIALVGWLARAFLFGHYWPRGMQGYISHGRSAGCIANLCKLVCDSLNDARICLCETAWRRVAEWLVTIIWKCREGRVLVVSEFAPPWLGEKSKSSLLLDCHCSSSPLPQNFVIRSAQNLIQFLSLCLLTFVCWECCPRGS